MFTLPTSFSLLPTRISRLLCRKATWCINSHATATVSMYVVSPKSCRTELNSIFPNLCALSLLRNAYFLPVNAKLPSRLINSLLLLIQQLDFIFYKIQSVLNIMMTVYSLFLPNIAPFSSICSSFHSCPRLLLFPSICFSFHLFTFIKTSNPTLC